MSGWTPKPGKSRLLPAAILRYKALVSLKLRVLGSIAALLILSLLAGAILLSVHAHALVELEVRTAFNGAAQSVRDTLRSDVQHTVTLREVVSSFQGQRHVRAALVNENKKVIVQSQIGRLSDPAPAWFARLMTPPPLTARFPIALPGYPCLVVLTSDAHSEVAEVWGHVRDAFVIMLLFCVSTLAVVSLAVGAGLRFLDRFQMGLQAISDSRFGTRLDVKGPPEFTRLAQGFNHMASELSAFSRANRQLYAQLQNVQEEERAEIARDLHDEVGPYLFALQVDAKAVGALNAPGASRLSASVREAVIHIQQQVRNILRQLRPVTQLEFGLEAAIGDLAAFWMRRNPDIRFERTVDLKVPLERRHEEAAYRIVQEAVSNAVRHGNPKVIEIAVRSDGGQLTVTVKDDGDGAQDIGEERINLSPISMAPISLGQAGIAGMRERVAALKGRLDIDNLPGHGVRLCAVLPLAREHEPA
ncbi:MAG TPA: histidine kinase [Rhizomicrobium sp.]|nr:histidine kinase [Rhizomicrobium sp.]